MYVEIRTRFQADPGSIPGVSTKNLKGAAMRFFCEKVGLTENKLYN